MRRPARSPLMFVLVLAASGCSGGGPAALEERDEAQALTDPAFGWVADYFGGGTGQVDGQPFEVSGAQLHIAFDADSVRLPACPTCVTVVLDSVFALANVRVTDPTEMSLTYDDGPVRYSLALLRFSTGGGLGNAVSARATIGNAGVPTPFFDVTYVLERP